MSDIVQIIAAILGSLGFGIVFKMKRRRLAFACIGGGITWTVYLICIAHGQSLFMANFIATLFASVFSIIACSIGNSIICDYFTFSVLHFGFLNFVVVLCSCIFFSFIEYLIYKCQSRRKYINLL